MKTNVLMKREFMGSEVEQRTDNGFFSATSLVRIGNKWRINNDYDLFNMSEWLRQKNTKDFIATLESEFKEKCVISGRGRGHHTWVHPYVFIDMALSINPELKLKVYSWIYDSLIKYRNDSGDSYKKMTGALWNTQENKSNFSKDISAIAFHIKKSCGVEDWQTASEKQLKLRDKIHEYIALLSDIIRDRKNLIDIAISKAKDEMNTPEMK